MNKKIHTLIFCMISTVMSAQQNIMHSNHNGNIITILPDQQSEQQLIKSSFLKEIETLINDSSLQINALEFPTCTYLMNHNNGLIDQEIKELVNRNYTFYPRIKNSKLIEFNEPIRETDKFLQFHFSKNGYVVAREIYATNSTKPITLLGLAVYKNNKTLIQYLVYLGANLNDYYLDYRYPLHDAATSSDSDLVELLLSLGAHYNIQNGIGATPLYQAVEFNECAIVKLLLDANADPNIADREGYSPLHMVVFGNNFKSKQDDRCDMIRKLLHAGADINAQNRYGQTPLMVAAFFNYVDAAKLLITSGADEGIVDNNGNTHLDLPVTEEMRNAIDGAWYAIF